MYASELFNAMTKRVQVSLIVSYRSFADRLGATEAAPPIIRTSV